MAASTSAFGEATTPCSSRTICAMSTPTTVATLRAETPLASRCCRKYSPSFLALSLSMRASPLCDSIVSIVMRKRSMDCLFHNALGKPCLLHASVEYPHATVISVHQVYIATEPQVAAKSSGVNVHVGPQVRGHGVVEQLLVAAVLDELLGVGVQTVEVAQVRVVELVERVVAVADFCPGGEGHAVLGDAACHPTDVRNGLVLVDAQPAEAFVVEDAPLF